MSSAKWRPFCLGLNVLSIIAYTKGATWSAGIVLSRQPFESYSDHKLFLIGFRWLDIVQHGR